MGAHLTQTGKPAFAGLIGSVLTMSIALVGVAPMSQATPKSRFTSCQEITDTFPRGIAVSTRAAARAVRQGFLRPQVRKGLYRNNAKRFDKRKRGYLCPVRPEVDADTDSTNTPEAEFVRIADSARVASCKLQDLRSTPNLTVGFPVPSERLNSAGSVPISVIYVDFPDFPASANQSDPARHFSALGTGIDTFFRSASFGKMSFDWSVHPTYVRMPSPISAYGISRRGGQFAAFMQQVISQADPMVDFTGKQAVVVVLNPLVPESRADVSPAFPLSQFNAFSTEEGSVTNGTLVAGDAHRIGASIISHEIGHLFGLTDLYNTSWRPGDAQMEQFKYSGWFDFMSYAPGRAREMLGWHRWILGWLADGEVHCIVEAGDTEVKINALASPTSGQKLAVIPLDATRALVVESRTRGFYCDVCDTGILVTLVDTAKGTGNGPIRVLRKTGSVEPLFADAILSPGESVFFEDVTITTIAKSATGYTIRVSRGNL